MSARCPEASWYQQVWLLHCLLICSIQLARSLWIVALFQACGMYWSASTWARPHLCASDAIACCLVPSQWDFDAGFCVVLSCLCVLHWLFLYVKVAKCKCGGCFVCIGVTSKLLCPQVGVTSMPLLAGDLSFPSEYALLLLYLYF